MKEDRQLFKFTYRVPRGQLYSFNRTCWWRVPPMYPGSEPEAVTVTVTAGHAKQSVATAMNSGNEEVHAS